MSNTQKDFYKKLLGKNGEKLAANYLKKRGYKILEKNYTTHFGEADIIASFNGNIVFVEVKTRTTKVFGLPSEAVTLNKQQRYRKIALAYLQAKNIEDASISFAVVEILGDEINLIEEAF